MDTVNDLAYFNSKPIETDDKVKARTTTPVRTTNIFTVVRI